MASNVHAPLEMSRLIMPDPELELVDCLANATIQAGGRIDRTGVANFYVALKHRPMLVLAGPAGCGKAAFVSYLANHLAGGNGLQRQVLPGHAWYAGMSPVNTLLMSMHSRLVTEKLLFIIEEALLQENSQQVFVVALTHISPAELLSFFTEVAYQVRHDQIMRIGDIHLSAPIPFPPNLFLIGTMDTANFDWWDEGLLGGATVIEWGTDGGVSQSGGANESSNGDGRFLQFCLRSNQKAYEKLLSVLAGHKQPLHAIMLVRKILEASTVEFSPELCGEVILYLANAWSQQGNGLFDSAASRNLAIASDLAMAQLVLPRNLKAIRSSETLQGELVSILDKHLPRSSAFLKRQCAGHPS